MEEVGGPERVIRGVGRTKGGSVAPAPKWGGRRSHHAASLNPAATRTVPSCAPDRDERPSTHDDLREPRLGVMLHYDDSSNDASAVAWFTDSACRVSYDILVLADGTYVPIVPREKRAWHAHRLRSAAAHPLRRHCARLRARLSDASAPNRRSVRVPRRAPVGPNAFATSGPFRMRASQFWIRRPAGAFPSTPEPR